METHEETIDLRELLGILKKRFWMIFVITLISIIISAVYSFYFITPQYEAKTELLVNKENSAQDGVITQQQIDTNRKLMETYSVIIKTPRILKPVAKEVGMASKEKLLASMINVAAVKESQVMSVTVTHENPKKAVEIANTIAVTFKTEIVNIMSVDNVQILTEAEYDQTAAPVKPNKIKNIAIAFIIGLIVSIGLVLLLEFLDKTVKTELDVTRKFGLPVLGAIPVMKEEDFDMDMVKRNQSFREVAAAREHRS